MVSPSSGSSTSEDSCFSRATIIAEKIAAAGTPVSCPQSLTRKRRRHRVRPLLPVHTGTSQGVRHPTPDAPLVAPSEAASSPSPPTAPTPICQPDIPVPPPIESLTVEQFLGLYRAFNYAKFVTEEAFLYKIEQPLARVISIEDLVEARVINTPNSSGPQQRQDVKRNGTAERTANRRLSTKRDPASSVNRRSRSQESSNPRRQR